MKLARDTWLIFQRQMTLTLRSPSWIFFGLAQPITYLLLFTPFLKPALASMGATSMADAYRIYVPGLLVVTCLFSMLLQPEGSADSLFLWVFQVPSLALGLPALAGMVDQERRAGCLDLALSAPAAEAYFVRRAAAVCAVIAVQGYLVMILGWFIQKHVDAQWVSRLA